MAASDRNGNRRDRPGGKTVYAHTGRRNASGSTDQGPYAPTGIHNEVRRIILPVPGEKERAHAHPPGNRSNPNSRVAPEHPRHLDHWPAGADSVFAEAVPQRCVCSRVATLGAGYSFHFSRELSCILNLRPQDFTDTVTSCFHFWHRHGADDLLAVLARWDHL